MTWRKRVDGNHALIVQTLRKCGWLVADTSRLSGWCDLVAYKPGLGTKLIEVKDGKGTLTPAQLKLRADGWPVVIVRSVDDALAL